MEDAGTRLVAVRPEGDVVARHVASLRRLLPPAFAPSPRADRAFLVAGAVMVVLTLTWINLSRIFSGMHSYA